MPLYAYKGLGAGGKSVSGVRDADSPKSLRQLMRKDGVVVTECSLSKKKPGEKGKGLNRNIEFGDLFGGVKKQEIAAFTRQMATLVKAGIPLAESLGAMFDQTENLRLKGSIEEIRAAVNEGSTFADALTKHPKLFDNLYVAMVRAGETAGNLDEVLTRLADFMENAQKLKSKVQGAMIYPIIMMVVGAGIMAILMVAVVPKITSIFVGKGKELPLPTEIVIWISNFIGNWWLFIILGIAGGVYAFRRWTKTKAGKRTYHTFALRAPALGSLIRQVAVARFTRTLGTMLKAGVPMLRALDTSKEILGNVVLVDVVDKAKTAVTEGESLAVALKRSGEFPSTVTHMIAVGERSGQLEEMLLRVSDAYDQGVDARLTKFTATLEPLMIVIMGGAIFGVVVAIMLPLLDMQQFAK